MLVVDVYLSFGRGMGTRITSAVEVVVLARSRFSSSSCSELAFNTTVILSNHSICLTESMMDKLVESNVRVRLIELEVEEVSEMELLDVDTVLLFAKELEELTIKAFSFVR